VDTAFREEALRDTAAAGGHFSDDGNSAGGGDSGWAYKRDFLSEYSSLKLRNIIKPVIEILAAVRQLFTGISRYFF